MRADLVRSHTQLGNTHDSHLPSKGQSDVLVGDMRGPVLRGQHGTPGLGDGAVPNHVIDKVGGGPQGANLGSFPIRGAHLGP